MAQEDVFWLQVAMDDLLLLQQVEGAEHVLGEPADQLEGEAPEGIGLDELIKVHVQELGGDAKMSAEIEAVGEINHAVLVFRVLYALLAQASRHSHHL